MWYSGHSNKVTRITCIFPHTSPKLLSYIFFSVTEKLCKNGLRIPIPKHFFLFRNSLLLTWKKFIFLWCKICSASSLQSDYYSCSCVYRKQHRCNCCQVEPRLFFFLKFICKCAHYLPFLLCLTLSWCHIQKVPVSYYCPLQFIKHTEMRSIRQKVFDALELVKSEIQSSEIQTAVVAGYYSVIWLFCF